MEYEIYNTLKGEEREREKDVFGCKLSRYETKEKNKNKTTA
jgi:hypothetical protein